MINYTCDHCGKRCGQTVFYKRKWLSIDLSDYGDYAVYHFCPTCADSIEAYVRRYLKNPLVKKKH